jgi:peptidyl-prolyl cis-trans isomerase SurA
MRVLTPVFGLLLAAVAALPLPFLPAASPALAQQPAAPAEARAPRLNPAQGAAIAAVVNGDVISIGDMDNRARLFALSTGLPVSQDVLDRLLPQVRRQLIDERLRLQELQRRAIAISDQEIAAAIGEIEASNGLPRGMLRQRLAAAGVDLRTMIDQIRVQIGWSRLLRGLLGRNAEVSPTEISELEAALRTQVGQQEWRVAEIFVPIGEARQAADAQRFADTIIAQLRSGANFGVVAAQFSQSQTALQGGDLGWVQANQLDPEVLRIVQIMPAGAVSNPIRVPGGLSIVTLRAKRVIGSDNAVVAHIRQAFFPFASRLNAAAPTEEQRATLEKARAAGAAARSCDDIERANTAAGAGRPADPGELRVDGIGNPALRDIVASLPLGRTSQPLIAEDGVAVLMVCSRETKNLGVPTPRELSQRILSERVELTGRQLMRELQRRATIDIRS